MGCLQFCFSFFTQHSSLGPSSFLSIFSQALNTLADDPAYQYTKYKLSDLEWQLIADMVKFLSKFDKFTKAVCSNHSTAIPNVILIFNNLFQFLETVAATPTTLQLIKMAATMALHILCKYYSKTDDTAIFVVSVCEFSFSAITKSFSKFFSSLNFSL